MVKDNVMSLSISRNELLGLVIRQLDSLFTCSAQDTSCLDEYLDQVIARCLDQFSRITNKYYSRDEKVFFNAFHSGQYSIFLYWLSRYIFQEKGERHRSLCDRLFYLNKTLNSLDLYYEIEMPPYFLLDHPLGSVMGRAGYKNGFVFSQQCTVGGNKSIYPIFGENVILFSGANVLGKCSIGSNVLISANTCVIDIDIPDFSIVYGRPRDYVVKSIGDEYFQQFNPFNL